MRIKTSSKELQAKMHSWKVSFVNAFLLSLTGPYVQFPVITKELRMEGFVVSRWDDRKEEGLIALLKWIEEVKTRQKVDFPFACK